MSRDRKLKLLVVMLKASQNINEIIRKDMLNYGVNPTEFAVLELLYSKGDQPIQHIGKKILLASSSITYVVDKLEERGYVKRLDCPDDRRVKFASITDKGREFMEESFPKHANLIEDLFSHLSDEEVETAIGLLKKIGKRENGLV